ncbi:MAG: type I methionyl aminopeptidase [Gemmataceae bacterium]
MKSFFPSKPELKTTREIALMREAGKLVAEALRLCRSMAIPGIKTQEIDQAVEELYRQKGAIPLFKGYPGKVPFPAVTCISLNEEVVHGVPGPRRIEDGDLLKIDTACKLNGWCADAAISLAIGNASPGKKRLIEVGEATLELAARELGRKRWWSEVAAAMQKLVESAGFSVVTQYVGHGIGRTMHENPQVPNFVGKELRRHDFRLEDGLVLAIEPMVNMGKAETEVKRDHWTVVTRDGLPSVHVEHTFALTREGVYVVTADEELLIPRSEPPPITEK